MTTSTVPSPLSRTDAPARVAIFSVSWSRWSRSSFALPPDATAVRIAPLRSATCFAASLSWPTCVARAERVADHCASIAVEPADRAVATVFAAPIRALAEPGSSRCVARSLQADQSPSSFADSPSAPGSCRPVSSWSSAVARASAYAAAPAEKRTRVSSVEDARRAIASTETPWPASAAVPRTNPVWAAGADLGLDDPLPGVAGGADVRHVLAGDVEAGAGCAEAGVRGLQGAEGAHHRYRFPSKSRAPSVAVPDGATGVVGVGVRHGAGEGLLRGLGGDAEEAVVLVPQRSDAGGELEHRGEVRRQDLAPRAGRGSGDDLAERSVGGHAPLLGDGGALGTALEAGAAEAVEDLLDLTAGVRDPPGAPGGEQELLLLELEREQFEQFAFAPQDGGQVVHAHQLPPGSGDRRLRSPGVIDGDGPGVSAGAHVLRSGDKLSDVRRSEDRAGVYPPPHWVRRGTP